MDDFLTIARYYLARTVASPKVNSTEKIVSTERRPRKYIDCREVSKDADCSLKISGTEAEVLAAAAEHAVSAHGYRGRKELRVGLRVALKNEA
jgi:Protein of unknown function (DUF1059)